MNQQCIGIIPARFASTRFPGKPLVQIGGQSMISRVIGQASKALEHVVVATDDDRIYQHVKALGARVVMTSDDHPSGTDRCAEALRLSVEMLGQSFDVVINIQGDEPFIQPEQIRQIKDCFDHPGVQIATLARSITDFADLENPNIPKLVLNKRSEALLFSRSAIPFIRSAEREFWPGKFPFLRHIGMYAYRSHILEELTRLEPTSLEKAESLEQLRWLEHGYRIRVAVTSFDSIGIDTPDDLMRAEDWLKASGGNA